MKGAISIDPTALPDFEAMLAAADHGWTPEIDAVLARYYATAAKARKTAELCESINRKFGKRFNPDMMKQHARRMGLAGKL